MCYKLGQKRVKRHKKKLRLSKPKNNISRITYKPYQRPNSSQIFKTEPAKKEEILNVPELVASNQETIPPANHMPEPLNERHSEIRQLVKDKIDKGEASQPITESLYFISNEAEFAYVDFDPFLLAVEFALQGKMVLVEGHTDDTGSESHNLELSMKRVRQIERLMRDIGVPEERVSVIGYGEEMPKYDNATEEGRQKNRRVDFKIF